MDLSTKELAARNRRAFLASVDAYLSWGRSPEELAQDRADDEAYFAQRAAEYVGPAAEGDDILKAERIYERQRARDRAFS